MTFKQLCFITGILFYSLNGFSQPSMQFKFCGKTAAVVPATDNGGNDQRHKGGLRLDLIRIGRLGQSRTSPFFSLGVTPGIAFKNSTWVDGCASNTNQTYCSGCSTCKPILNTSNGSIGVSEGKMLENVRLRSANNDFFLESTGSQNVVCFVSDPFDVSSQGGKTIELNAIYEGTSVDGFTSVNVNISYRYNNDAWVQLLNQNSNFIRVVDTAILLIAKVPNAVANLDGIVDFSISPNPVKDLLFVQFESQNTFDGNLQIRDLNGKIILDKPTTIQSGKGQFHLKTDALQPAVYLFQIADQEGRISTRKFIKK
ncbi:MAG: T9SS type A sorting domain-containing protein [Saprospiraceae bacterium]|nr:T9SS type A sorting domain-containing protein [Saprospiraceae bacterium]